RLDEALTATAEGIRDIGDADPTQLSSLLTTRGDIFYAMQQTDSAFVYYDMAINLDPGNTTAKNNAAYYLAVENRDLDRAEKLILQAIDENPDQPTSLDTYAWVLFRKGDYEAARQVIDRTLELDSDPSAEELEHAGDIYFMLDEVDRAVEFWQQALEDEPDNDELKTKIKNKRI
ncbi:MAG: tetratricopeptide repeat protein, partial [Roseburia sp.]|nr:tetratricopeptide repeat protein [Roseburia sp.]